MARIKDKITGEIFDIPDSFGDLEGLETEGSVVEQKIAQRGQETFVEAKERFSESEGVIQKTLAGLNVAAIPQERTEAGIANSLLALQAGRPQDIISEFQKGVRGEKLGEIGDVFREAGASEIVSASAGLIISFISPLVVISKGIKALKGISKFTDRGIKLAGKRLAGGAESGVKIIGRHLDDVYKPINDITADADKFIKTIDDLPDVIVRQVEKELGKNLDDLALEGARISDIRKIKQIIGQLRPSKFGKETKGAIQTLEDINVNKSYGKVKNLIQETLADKNMAKEATELLKADDAMTETIRAANFIKKQITDPTLLLPTKAGRVARGIIQRGDVTTRSALNTLSKAGGTASKEIQKALLSLDRFNTIVNASKIAGTLTRWTLLGGAAGLIGNKIFKDIQER